MDAGEIGGETECEMKRVGASQRTSDFLKMV